MPVNRYRKYRKSYGSRRRTMGSGRSYGNRNKSTSSSVARRKFKIDRAMAPTYVRGNDWMSGKLYNSMEYAEQIYYTSVSPPQSYIFRGNSIYDPNQSGTGGQPIGMTTLTSIYSVYECPSCSIRVEWINNTNIPLWITIAPVVNTAYVVTYNSSQGVPGAKTVYCPGNNSNAHGVITNWNSTFKTTGLIQDTGASRSLVTTNPVTQWYWNITLTPCDNVSALSGVLNVKLIYKTIWTDRKVI